MKWLKKNDVRPIRSIHLGLSKVAYRIQSKWIWIGLAVIAFVIGVAPWLGNWTGHYGFSRFVVDVFSPVSLRNIAYNVTSGSTVGKGYENFSSAAHALGVILISGILIPIITNYFRTLGDRYKTGTLSSYPWRNRALFLGYDELMIGTLRMICESGTKKTKTKVVIAVPDNVEYVRSRVKALLPDVKKGEVEVIQCNKIDKKDLRKKARVQTASRIFIIGQPDDETHDATNLRSMDMIADIVGEKVVPCYVYIRNRASLTVIQRQDFVEKEDKKLRKAANPFNFYENIARKLLTGFSSGNSLMTLDYHNAEHNLAVCPDANVHLVIMGMTEVGVALAREVIMLAHYPGRRVKITFVDENAREKMFYFRGRYKAFFKMCNYSYEDLDKETVDPEKEQHDNTLLDIDFDFVQGSIAHPTLMKRIEEWSRDKTQIFTMVICTEDSPKNMATALYLPHDLLNGDLAIPIWVYQQGDDSLKKYCGHAFYKNIHTFSANEYGNIDIYGSFEMSWAEEVAKVHEQLVTKGTPTTTWDEMTQYDRWSSLNNACSIVTKLRGMGYEIVMDEGKLSIRSFANGQSAKCSSLSLSNEEFDKLVVTEHIRWMAEMLIKGFRCTTDKEHEIIDADKSLKDKYKEEYFAHDNLRPFAKLDEDATEFDIDMTNAMVGIINDQLNGCEKEEKAVRKPHRKKHQ